MIHRSVQLIVASSESSRTSYFGFNPRQCFGSSSFPSLPVMPVVKRKRFLDNMEVAAGDNGFEYDLD